MEWNEEKSQEVLQKHKKRFGIRLSVRITSIILGLLFLFTIYYYAINAVLSHSKSTYRTMYYAELALDWKSPTYTASPGWSEKNEISPLLAKTLHLSVAQTVGRKDYTVSELTIKRPLISRLSKLQLNNEIAVYYSSDGFEFSLPYYPEEAEFGHQKLTGTNNSYVWRNLDKIHDTNVATLAFSLDDFYQPAEVIKLLDSYDLDIIWMPTYMGELKYNRNYYMPRDENNFIVLEQWGLSGARTASEDFGVRSMNTSIDSVYDEEIMMENMQKMLTKDKNLAEALLQTRHLQNRYDYLIKNGFEVYGAVVTGPVEELRKLQDLQEIRSPQLGEVKPWNWYGEFDDD